SAGTAPIIRASAVRLRKRFIIGSFLLGSRQTGRPAFPSGPLNVPRPTRVPVPLTDGSAGPTNRNPGLASQLCRQPLRSGERSQHAWTHAFHGSKAMGLFTKDIKSM